MSIFLCACMSKNIHKNRWRETKNYIHICWGDSFNIYIHTHINISILIFFSELRFLGSFSMFQCFSSVHLNPSVGTVSQGCWKAEAEQKQLTDSFFLHPFCSTYHGAAEYEREKISWALNTSLYHSNFLLVLQSIGLLWNLGESGMHLATHKVMSILFLFTVSLLVCVFA